MTNEVAKEFLKDLDDADHINLTDWEAKFIESNYSRDTFTEKQFEVIERMKKKYESRL
jgi:hypothetical protein